MRATKGVALCAPTKYADIACERARAYIPDLLNGSAGQIGSGTDDEIKKAVMTVARRMFSPGDGNWSLSSCKVHPRLEERMWYL